MEDTSETYLDDVMSCLANETRRGILATLRATDSGDGVDERELVARTTEVTAVATRHVHLPKLEAADLIEWDMGDRDVFRGQHFEAAVELLEAFESTLED